MDNKINEELVTWKIILDEIRGESELLVRDLLEGINYVAAAGLLMMIFGGYLLFIGVRYGNTDDPLFLVLLILTSGSSLVTGLYNLNKYLQLRSRYSRLFDIQEKLKK